MDGAAGKGTEVKAPTFMQHKDTPSFSEGATMLNTVMYSELLGWETRDASAWDPPSTCCATAKSQR